MGIICFRNNNIVGEKILEGSVRELNEKFKKHLDEEELNINIKTGGSIDDWNDCEFWTDYNGIAATSPVLKNINGILEANLSIMHLDLDFKHDKSLDKYVVTLREGQIYKFYHGWSKFENRGYPNIFGDGGTNINEDYNCDVDFKKFCSVLLQLSNLSTFKFHSRFSNVHFDGIQKLFESLNTLKKTLIEVHVSFSRNACYDFKWKSIKISPQELSTLFETYFKDQVHSFSIGGEL